ncbi:hypothetical protein Tco_0879151 [Tanacetum coccineum]
MAHICRATMEEHQAAKYGDRHVGDQRKLAERWEQMGNRAYEEDKRREEWNQKIKEDKWHEEWNQKIEVDKRREEWNEKIKELKNLIQSFIQNPISPPVTTKVPAKPIQNTPRFEENSGQSFSSDKAEKEVKDISFIGALATGSEVANGYGGENLLQTDNIPKNLNLKGNSTCIGSLESTNNQENRITIGAGDQSRVSEKDVPSHGLRKQQLGGLIFSAKVEILVDFDLRTFEEIHYDLGKGQERRTLNPGILYHHPGRSWNIVF